MTAPGVVGVLGQTLPPQLDLRRLVSHPGIEEGLKAARQVVARPAVVHNPLVISGPDGSGCTHLLAGIGLGLGARGKVVAADTPVFMEQVGKIGSWENVKEQLVLVQGFLLDGIHGVDSDELDALAWLIHYLVEAGVQVVISTPSVWRPPDGLAKVLKEGHTTYLESPGFNSLMAVIDAICDDLGFKLGSSITQRIAERYPTNLGHVRIVVEQVIGHLKAGRPFHRDMLVIGQPA